MAASRSADKKEPAASFEQEFERLAAIVDRLEQESISLDEMMKLYEEGAQLSASLSKLLREAELRIQTISQVHEEMEHVHHEDANQSSETFIIE